MASPAYFCVYNFVHPEDILLAHAYYIQFYSSRSGCYAIGPMYLKHATGDGRLSAFSQLWDSLPYPSSSDRVLRHIFPTHRKNVIYAVFRQSMGGREVLAEGKRFLTMKPTRCTNFSNLFLE